MCSFNSINLITETTPQTQPLWNTFRVVRVERRDTNNKSTKENNFTLTIK